MTFFRIIDTETRESPCPDEVWIDRELAEKGLDYWQAEHPEMKLAIFENKEKE